MRGICVLRDQPIIFHNPSNAKNTNTALCQKPIVQDNDGIEPNLNELQDFTEYLDAKYQTFITTKIKDIRPISTMKETEKAILPIEKPYITPPDQLTSKSPLSKKNVLDLLWKKINEELNYLMGFLIETGWTPAVKNIQRNNLRLILRG